MWIMKLMFFMSIVYMTMNNFLKINFLMKLNFYLSILYGEVYKLMILNYNIY